MSEFKDIRQDKVESRFTEAEGEISRRELLERLVPFGKVRLDGSRCTGCSLCVIECSTGALTASSSEETDGYQLLFRHGSCIACGRCVEVCPERCLQLERILELDRIDSPAIVLFEDRIVRCRECGSIIGSRAMIDRLQVKVLATGDSLASHFELCPVCKIKAEFSRGRLTLKPAAEPD